MNGIKQDDFYYPNVSTYLGICIGNEEFETFQKLFEQLRKHLMLSKQRKQQPTKPFDTLYAKILGKIQLNFFKSNLLKNLLQLKVSQRSTGNKL